LTVDLTDFGVIEDVEKRFKKLQNQYDNLPYERRIGFWHSALKKDPELLKFVRADKLAKSRGV
jgi:hypothetical protein